MSHVFEKEGAEILLRCALQNDSPPSTFYLALMAFEGNEIPAGNGYTEGGKEVPRTTSGFINLTTGSDYAQIKISRTEYPTSGGQIPRYGSIRYADLTTDEADVNDRTHIARFDLGADVVVPDGKQLALTNGTMRLQEVSLSGVTFTVNGLKALLQYTFQNDSPPSTYYLALLTPDSPAGETMGDCIEIPSGNGYTSGGIQVARSTSGFVELVNDWQPVRHASIQIAEQSFQTAGGPIPRYGSAQKAALTTDEATVSNRKVLAVIDFDEAVIAPNGKLLVVDNGTLWINET